MYPCCLVVQKFHLEYFARLNELIEHNLAFVILQFFVFVLVDSGADLLGKVWVIFGYVIGTLVKSEILY